MKKGRVHCPSCRGSIAVGQEDCLAICGDCGGGRATNPETLIKGCVACGSRAVATRWPDCQACAVEMTPGPPVSSCSCNLGPGCYGFGGHHHMVTTKEWWELKIWRDEFQAEPGVRDGPKLSTVLRVETIVDEGDVLELPVTIAMELDRRASKLAGSVVLYGENGGKCPAYYAATVKSCGESRDAKAAEKHGAGSYEGSY